MYHPHGSEKIAEITLDGEVTNVYMSDFYSLEVGQWLSDHIIEWYLKDLYNNYLYEENQQRTFIYSPRFFTALEEEFLQNLEIRKKSIPYMGINVISSSHHHWFHKISDFTRGVNIFEKDFIIIPVKEKDSHWYVIFVCFPGLVGSDQVNDDDDNDEKKYPCILVFNSLKTASRTNDFLFLRNYLSMEYYKQFNKYKSFTEDKLKCYYPIVPMQSKASDCGLFMLQYVKSFFWGPIKVYPPSINSLEEWFFWEAEYNRITLFERLVWTSKGTEGRHRLIHFPNINLIPLLSDEDEDNDEFS